MMLQILAVFPCVRSLLEDLRELQNSHTVLQDRLETALNDRARVWELMIKAQDAERTSYRMQINIQYQRAYGIVPYPDDPKLPPSMAKEPEPGDGPATRLTPSQAVERQTERVLQQIKERFQKVKT